VRLSLNRYLTVEDILPATAQQVKIGSGNIRLDSAVRCQVLSFLSLVLCFKGFLAWATAGSSIILPRTAVTPLPEFSKRLQILRLRRQSVECFSTSNKLPRRVLCGSNAITGRSHLRVMGQATKLSAAAVTTEP
jgi:hypothetical protein